MRRMVVLVAVFAAAASIVPAAAGATTTPNWAVQTTPNPTVPTGHLYAVSCTSSTACTAVGSYESSAGAATLAERWNGTKWVTQSTPNPSGNQGAELDGVSCASATSCIAVGSYDKNNVLFTLAERWNGTAWAIVTTPKPTGSLAAQLAAVSCTSASACTAVGNYTNSGGNDVSLAERWNGSTWAIQTTPNPAGATVTHLQGVSCPSATACTAVGSSSNGTFVTLAERWNGSAWAIETTANPAGATTSQLSGISCPSTTACTATGDSVDGSSNQTTLAEAWNGTAWSIQTTPNPSGGKGFDLGAVSCTSSTACTAVGAYVDSGGTEVPVAERWNGTTWSIQTTPKPATTTFTVFGGVACTSSTACTAVGWYQTTTFAELTLAEHWNGTSWTIQPTANSPGATQAQLQAVSCASATACTAVGNYVNKAHNQVTLAEAWNGTSWAIRSSPNPSGAKASGLLAVSCTAANACTAVGYFTNSGGTDVALAERWNGTSWAIQTAQNPAGATVTHLQGVSCTSATACTAVGYYDDSSGNSHTLAERWNGSTWVIQITQDPIGPVVNFSLTGVSCSSATACTAVGWYQTIGWDSTLAETWDGTSWTLQNSANPSGPAHLLGVSCTAAAACTAVGFFNNSGTDDTLAERWNGSSWTIQSTPNPSGALGSHLNGVSCPSATVCQATGYDANSGSTHVTLAERWNGTTWAVQSTPNPAGAQGSFLDGVSCTASTACTAAGYDVRIATNVDATLAERYA